MKPLISLSVICLMLTTGKSVFCQTDTLNISLNLDEATISLENFDNEPFECNFRVFSEEKNTSLFRSMNHNFLIPVPANQYITVETTEDHYIFGFGDDGSDINEITDVVIILHRDEKVQPEELFQKDFLIARLGLSNEGTELKSVGKTIIGNQESFWANLTGSDEYGESNGYIFYLKNPIAERCMTILITTYSDSNIEEKLCSKFHFVKKIEWK